MEATHIVMVGASLVRNAARQHGDPQLGQCARARPGSPEDGACSPEASPGLVDLLYETLKRDPAAASAELNAMKPWLEAGQSPEGAVLSRVVLVSTDTGVGRLAAEALRRYLQDLAGSVEVVVVPGLGVEERFAQSLHALYSLIAETVRREKADGRCVASNLTGGFKPESGVALMATVAGGGDVAYYIHESFRKTVVIPLLAYTNKSLVRELLEGLEPAGDGGIVTAQVDALGCLARLLQPLGLARITERGAWLSNTLIGLLRGLASGFNP